jgi:thiamine biosynthesis lipoprotein
MPHPIFRYLFSIILSLAPFLVVHAEWFSDASDKMGTRVEVKLWHDDAIRAEFLIAQAMEEFDRIEAAMSTYRADSEISHINETAATSPVVVSPELFGLIDRAQQLSAKTDGAFDITYDSVGQFYDYREGIHPAPEQIETQLGAIDYRHVRLDRDASVIRFARPGVRINLGGIAKGYAVESVIELLREAGVTNALATAGGDTRLLGDRGNGPWIVGVRDPDDSEGLVTKLALQDEAISTSGDYERFFIEDDVRYHHILDPSTGRSVGHVRSVTIIGPDATMTDGLSTSVFVLGTEAGLELIELFENYEALIIDTEHRIRFSSGVDPR